jgi:N-acyl-D-amino-acid deacylase
MKIRNLLIFILMATSLIFFVKCSKDKPDFDIIIKNGIVADGLGGKPFRADIGIFQGKIKEIGILQGDMAKKIIDAANLMVCPGFIDLHTHTDRGILEQPEVHNYIHQGVTTIVGGNCGGSQFPIGTFLKKVEEKKIAPNFCTLVGHNTARKKVMENANREPSPEELAEMKKLVEQAMQEGAVGISTGLKYIPGAYARTDEVIELAKVVQQYGGFYATHMREEGQAVLEAVKETIEIGRFTQLPVHISHHKITSVDHWGDSEKSLELVDNAIKAGINVTLDQYPYPATSTGLTVLFPAWALEGDLQKRKERLNDEKQKKQIIEAIMYNIRHDRGGNDLNRILIARYTPEPELEGLSIAQILEKKGMAVTLEAGAELIVQMQLKGMNEKNEQIQAIYFCLHDKDIERIMKHPLVSHASDGGLTKIGVGKPHPRNYGTFPRVLGVYVREKGTLTFEEAIRKMTSLPAKRLGLTDRGCIKKGYHADIVILDPNKIADTATWKNPHSYPEGISYVLVNGQPVVENNKFSGLYPGKVIYGRGYVKRKSL